MSEIVCGHGDHGGWSANGQTGLPEKGFQAAGLGIVRIAGKGGPAISHRAFDFAADSCAESHDQHTEEAHDCACRGERGGLGHPPRQGIARDWTVRDRGEAAIGQAASDWDWVVSLAARRSRTDFGADGVYIDRKVSICRDVLPSSGPTLIPSWSKSHSASETLMFRTPLTA